MRSNVHLSVLLMLLLTIGCSGEDSNAPTDPADSSILRVPEDYPDLASAIADSEIGFEISVAPGTYEGTENRNLVIEEEQYLTISGRSGEASPILELDLRSRAFTVSPGATLLLDRMKIQNGRADIGGAIRITSGTAILKDVVVESCAASYGGALLVEQATLVLERTSLRGNESTELDGGAVYAERSQVTIRETIISGNAAMGSGGGLSLDRSELELTRSTVSGNRAHRQGGGLFAGRFSTVHIDRTILWGNAASESGGARSGHEFFALSTAELSASCAASDTTDGHAPQLDGISVVSDPRFVEEIVPAQAPTTSGDLRLQADSPCAEEHSPCEERIGSLDVVTIPGFTVDPSNQKLTALQPSAAHLTRDTGESSPCNTAPACPRRRSPAVTSPGQSRRVL